MTVPLLALALMGTPSLSGAESTYRAKPSPSVAAKRKAKPSKVIAGVKASKTAARSKAPKTKAPIAQEAKLKRAARGAPATPVAPQSLEPIRRVEGINAASQGNEAAVSESRPPVVLWYAFFATALLAGAAFLWRRGRPAQPRWAPVEFIDPVLNLDLGDIATSQARFKADLPERIEPLFVNIAPEPNAKPWRLAEVNPG